MCSQYELGRRHMLRSNSSLASTNTVTMTTLKKNQVNSRAGVWAWSLIRNEKKQLFTLRKLPCD
jgi:hypothetical protein